MLSNLWKSFRRIWGEEDIVPKVSSSSINQRRILVLGARFTADLLTSYEWHRIPEKLNVADFQVVILNLVPFADRQYAESITGEQIQKLPKPSLFWQLFFSPDCEIVVLGSPLGRMGRLDARMESSFYGGKMEAVAISDLDWWKPVHWPEFVDDSGESIIVHDSRWDYYMSNVKRWTCYSTGEPKRSLYGSSVWPSVETFCSSVCRDANDVRFKTEKIAVNRQGNPLAFIFRALAVDDPTMEFNRFQQRREIRLIKESSTIIWLPATTDIDNNDALKLLLQERYSITVRKDCGGVEEAAAEFRDRMPAENDWAESKHEMSIQVFISHSSHDVDLAQAFIDLLRGCIEQFPTRAIRCTSVPGFKLDAGDHTSEKILGEIQTAKSFVGLLTMESLKSSYVLFELGARWGMKLSIAPFLGPTVTHSDIPSILSERHVPALNSKDDVAQEVQKIARECGFSCTDISLFNRAIETFQSKLEEISKKKLPPAL